MPALAVAVVLTFTRSAWVGACAAAALLFTLEGLPPAGGAADRGRDLLRHRADDGDGAVHFDIRPEGPDQPRPAGDAARRRAHDSRAPAGSASGRTWCSRCMPSTAIPDAVNTINPHLHNVPVQIAAERGLPALALWLWFVVALVIALAKRASTRGNALLAAAGLAAVTAMLAAGHVRVQLRRLRVPDDVPHPRDAAVRRRALRHTA